mmetsp:Transcript_33663/g.39220  ORF Transcript_33663/g.39220 Transcript_33663/m.39220 type:complete len:464 (+) Transcript_33663:49-1440(+)
MNISSEGLEIKIDNPHVILFLQQAFLLETNNADHYLTVLSFALILIALRLNRLYVLSHKQKKKPDKPTLNTSVDLTKREGTSKRPAATEVYGLSPTLIKAKSEIFPLPLPAHIRIFAWLLALFCSSAFYTGPLLLFLPTIVYFTYSTHLALGIVILDIILVFYPNQEWPFFRQLFQVWYELFDFHHNVTTETHKIFAKHNNLSILAMHPHGIIPIHAFIWSAFCDQYLPTLYGVGATTDAAQRLPILRQMLRWLSAGSADRVVIKENMIKHNKDLFILPGGVAEIFFSRRMEMNTTISQVHTIKAKRYGLMKLALQTGSIIVPSYVFGTTNFFDQIATIGDNYNFDSNQSFFSKSVGKFLESMSRRIKGGMTFYWGQYGTPMPHKTKVTLVLGNPIIPVPGTMGMEVTNERSGSKAKRTCRKIEDPTSEQIEELMNRYIDALERLFDQYKAQAGYENDILKVT